MWPGNREVDCGDVVVVGNCQCGSCILNNWIEKVVPIVGIGSDVKFDCFPWVDDSIIDGDGIETAVVAPGAMVNVLAVTAVIFVPALKE